MALILAPRRLLTAKRDGVRGRVGYRVIKGEENVDRNGDAFGNGGSGIRNI